jgi:hypothetical protein
MVRPAIVIYQKFRQSCSRDELAKANDARVQKIRKIPLDFSDSKKLLKVLESII